jgi:signal transduction histidine kinase
MSIPLRVLIVEDSEDDSLLLKAELARGGYDVSYERVETTDAMRAALQKSGWDIIISDHRMPQFSSLAALALYNACGCDIPFIVVSGSIGEELAVSAMKAGAHDYIMKDNLRRLLPAIERELREADVRRQRTRAHEDLLESNRQLEQTITQLRETQQQIIQQERLGALGQMASGVAHDFNNALSKILGFTELLLTSPEKLNHPEKAREYLQMINTSAQDAAHVVRRLREFSRPRRETEVFCSVDLNALIRNAIALTEPRWKDQARASRANIEVLADLEAAPAVTGNEGDLREVFTNLIFNAVDAMPSGGTLTIRTHLSDGHVLINVSDTGTGMTEAVRQHCLEPFFSTKGEHGTGLGLASVLGIVQRHDGSIDIQSEAGKGSTFSIRLPVRAGQEETPSSQKPISRARPLNVLVVEDEPLIRDIEAEYLACDGHSVETAPNGIQGLEKFRAGRFNLVVTDRAMPEMNGDQLAGAIKKLAPATPIILVTGFDEAMGNAAHRSGTVDWFLSKPFTHAALREAVGKVTSA